MRERSGAEHIRRFIEFIGGRARDAADVYFVGGGSAVLFGWRPTTIDLDLKLSSNDDEILRILAEAKERLRINIELASPSGLDDVSHMLADGLIEPGMLQELFNRIEPELFRFPAIDPASFRKDVEAFRGMKG